MLIVIRHVIADLRIVRCKGMGLSDCLLCIIQITALPKGDGYVVIRLRVFRAELEGLLVRLQRIVKVAFFQLYIAKQDVDVWI